VVTVESLSESKKRYDVVFQTAGGSKAAFRVSEDLVVEYRLVPGKILEDFAFSAFQRAAEADVWEQKAIAYVLRYPQTEEGMRKHLADRKVPKEAVARILRRLSSLKLLDDREYAVRYAEDHSLLRHEGKTKIAFELRSRGISPALVSEVVSQLPASREREAMNLLFDKKLPSLKDFSVRKAMANLQNHLIAKGFDPEAVRSFLESRAGVIAGRTDEEALLDRDYAEAVKKAEKRGLSGRELRESVLQTLARKGYSYPVVKKRITQGGDSDE